MSLTAGMSTWAPICEGTGAKDVSVFMTGDDTENETVAPDADVIAAAIALVFLNHYARAVDSNIVACPQLRHSADSASSILGLRIILIVFHWGYSFSFMCFSIMPISRNGARCRHVWTLRWSGGGIGSDGSSGLVVIASLIPE